MQTQSEQVLMILQRQIQKLLAVTESDPDDFQVAFGVALAVVRELDDAGIIGDANLLMLAREAMEKRGKPKGTALALFAHEFDHPTGDEASSVSDWKLR